MSSSSDTRVVAGAALAGVAVVAFVVHKVREHQLASQRAALIKSTEPLLTEGEQAVAAGAAEPPILTSDVALNLADIRKRLNAATSARSSPARLVAVSKTKPIEMLLEAYAAGQRDFGENYVQELVGKAPQMPADVHWHFIGGLQSNKAKELVKGAGPGLVCVETVDSSKLADKLHAAVASLKRAPLDVLIQVNTSPWEGSKNGVLAEDVPALADHIRGACPKLRLGGLMTIGAPGEPKCFIALVECREHLAAHLNVPAASLVLSMGMSNDFEQAIACGSDSVRVGSSVFGKRDYPAQR